MASTYFPRWLADNDENAPDSHIDDADLLSIEGNKIILGEPGMGKSELIRELGRRLEVEPISASRFIHARNPTKWVIEGKPLLIDGLDEAISRKEGDVVDAILAQLEEAGSPPFVLSCRSREWQGRSTSILSQLYSDKPRILTLMPFDRSNARAFLIAQDPDIDTDHVLDHLTHHSLEDLYRNPLMLGLMARVAKDDSQLPATRAALFERVCTLIWPEHDDDRQDNGLAQLAQDDALDAAGALAAGLIFGGAEAISAAGAAHMQQGDIRLADIKKLPSASAADAIYSSKLFQSVGPSRASPIHRVIAEYLAARWLAGQAGSPRIQRRVLAQLHGNGGVPISLRGLHAWLAFHSQAMAERVIIADPFGVLRYGEATVLSPHLAGCLLDALHRLSDRDPYFRAADWNRTTATGLMRHTLKTKIEALVVSTASNWQLRALLIEGLQGTPLAAELANSLELIVLEPDRPYRERICAAGALLPHRDLLWWRETIAELADQGNEDGPRLACRLIEMLNVDVSDELLVHTLFADIGLDRPSCRPKLHTRVRSYSSVCAAIPSERLISILDQITDHARRICDDGWENADRVANIVSSLVIRGIDERVIGVGEAPSLWRWLEPIERMRGGFNEVRSTLAARLEEHYALRRAVQAHVLANERREGGLQKMLAALWNRLTGLVGRPEDMVVLFDQLAQGDNQDPALREDWQVLVQHAWGANGLDPVVRTAAERFQRGDNLLGDFLRELENPRKPDWAIRLEEENTQRSLAISKSLEVARHHFGGMRDDIRAGNLVAIYAPAAAYFDFLEIPQLPSDVLPCERLSWWLGEDLCDDALIGFEAVLHRPDLPTAAEIAEGFARGETYNYCYPMMAGLYERLRNGKGVAALPSSLRQTALLLSYDDYGWNLSSERDALCAALEAEIITTLDDRKTLAQLWVEPPLKAGKENIAGLYKLAHDPEWQETGAILAADWLTRFPNVPASVEAELVNCLIEGGALDTLREIACSRVNTVFRDVDHLLAWVAIDVLVRFETVREDLAAIGARYPNFIWHLRDRLRFELGAKMLPLKVAQAEWIITEFRERWPYAELVGSGSGRMNEYDATDFLRALIMRITNDTGDEAAEAMARLVAGPSDTYTDLIRHMAAEQLQKRIDDSFSALAPTDLASILEDGPPSNIDDLKALVLEEFAVAQLKLTGDDVDSVRDFWTDNQIPRDENRCRDRLAAMLGPELDRYDVQKITEADMPNTKRADLAFANGTRQLPIEVKGQWHPEVWDAATDQLSVQYLIDWRSEGRGIYCVLWFGEVSSSTGRRLKSHPGGLPAPASAEEMRTMLIERIPEARRKLIEVVVLDLSAGKR
ncbi:NACHT domain-containing protein [Achromobacter xylosoxidans]|uniref:NACHT domain-containing protein n=1 Tax=Alcaligenes xylosoxydans xylosoxydans TaxID=85698 RepID=UPI000A5DBB4A|nr:hypothetical protein [Achromobacter xylosoxidans]